MKKTLTSDEERAAYVNEVYGKKYGYKITAKDVVASRERELEYVRMKAISRAATMKREMRNPKRKTKDEYRVYTYSPRVGNKVQEHVNVFETEEDARQFSREYQNNPEYKYAVRLRQKRVKLTSEDISNRARKKEQRCRACPSFKFCIRIVKQIVDGTAPKEATL